MVDNFNQASLKDGIVTLDNVKSYPFGVTNKATIIKVLYTGICRADIKEVSSSRDIPDDRGALFGHEFIGIVVNPGNCSFVDQNDYVTFNPNVTPNRTTAYSEYFFIEDTNEILQEALIKIEPTLVNLPWLPEPFACIVHSVRKLLALIDEKDFSNKKVGIIGAGNSGILFGFYIKYLKGNVTLLNRGRMRLDFINANHLFSESEFDELKNSSAYKDAFDVVVVVPTKIDNEVLAISRELLKKGGYMHLYGGTRENDKFLGTALDIDKIRRNEIKENIVLNKKSFWVSGAYGCSKTDFEEAISLYKERPDLFPLHKMVSKKIYLQEFPRIIMDMASGKIDFPGKVIVKP